MTVRSGGLIVHEHADLICEPNMVRTCSFLFRWIIILELEKEDQAIHRLAEGLSTMETKRRRQ